MTHTHKQTNRQKVPDTYFICYYSDVMYLNVLLNPFMHKQNPSARRGAACHRTPLATLPTRRGVRQRVREIGHGGSCVAAPS